MAALPRLCNISFHTTSHSNEEVIVNLDRIGCEMGGLIQIWDPEQPSNRLIVRVPTSVVPGSTRLEISVLKSMGDSVGFKQFGRVMVDRISESEARVDFVELSFRRQYLQRGNMFRLKSALIGRSIYMNQSISINNIQAQIQDIRLGSQKKFSGLVTQQTKFVFRSKSSRVVWLVQISAEMWDFDMSGDLYFEKFLKEFASPVLDSWKALGVSHMLSIIFFCRSFYFDRVTMSSHPELFAKKSFVKNSNGFYQQDFFRIVIENAADIDKVSMIAELRRQFWEFAQCVGWKVCKDPEKEIAARMISTSHDSSEEPGKGTQRQQAQLNYVVPSDAVHGNVLEAINSTLNILEKHYMDRDLQRSGNSIVLISVGSGLFKVKPNLAQITKQRMLDNAFGIDFISLSRPPIHTFPLFLVDCKSEGYKDFYEMPHWIRVSYIDCISQQPHAAESEAAHEPIENWVNIFVPPPMSSVLAATVMNADDLRGLTIGYVRSLPQALRLCISDQAVGDPHVDVPAETTLESALNSQVVQRNVYLPLWGALPPSQASTKRHHESGISSKFVFHQRDLLNLKTVALSRSPPFNKRMYVDIFESLPAMSHERDNIVAESYSSDEDTVGKSFDNASMESFLFDGYGYLLERSAGVKTKEVKHSLLDSTFQVKKLRDEILLGNDVDAERLEELFFQHDSSLFRAPPVTSPPPPPPPPTAGASPATPSAASAKRPASSTTIQSNYQQPALAQPPSPSTARSSSSASMSATTTPTPPQLRLAHPGAKPEFAAPLQQSQKSMLSTQLPNHPSISDRYKLSLAARSLRLEPGNSPLQRESGTNSPSQPPTNASADPPSADRQGASSAKSRLFGRSIMARNQFSRNLQTKIALVQGVSKPGAADVSGKKAGSTEYLQEYCKHYGINPFKQKEGKKYLRLMSHNRRRWAHVFPLGRSLAADYGLNWKSLTQPAILPLNTDYLPSVLDLKQKFTVHQYTIQFQQESSPFETLEDALRELVCQRLSQEFQLIEGVDQAPYMRLNNILSGSAVPMTRRSKDLGKDSGKELEQTNQSHGRSSDFYILTMGHRIHFLYADSANSQISVTQYVSNGGKNSDDRAEVENDKTCFTYRYEIWMPQRARFETVVQSFHQFPIPEVRWNLIDNTIAGELAYDGQDMSIKARRLKFILVPYAVRGLQDVEGYYAQVELLLDFFRKYLAKNEKISVTNDPTLSMLDGSALEPIIGRVSHNQRPAIYRQTSRSFSVARLVMRGPKHANPNWIYLRYDQYLYGIKAFHFELHWNVCDSWLVDDFVSLMYRRCSKWSLRVCQTPEYFTTSNLSVHPFKALPYLQLPDCPTKVPAPLSTPVRVLERCLFGRSQDWIFDSEQATDWSKIGVPPPNYADRDRDLLAQDSDALIASATVTSSTPSAEAAGASQQSRPATSWSRTFQRMVFKQDNEGPSAPLGGLDMSLGFRTSSVKVDRQYVHSSGLVVVRMAANGFIWMQNATSRISETPGSNGSGSGDNRTEGAQRPLMTIASGGAIASTAEEKIAMAVRMMRELETFCLIGAECYEIVVTLVEEAMRQSDSAMHISTTLDATQGEDGEVGGVTGGFSDATPRSDVSPISPKAADLYTPHFTSSHI